MKTAKSIAFVDLWKPINERIFSKNSDTFPTDVPSTSVLLELTTRQIIEEALGDSQSRKREPTLYCVSWVLTVNSHQVITQLTIYSTGIHPSARSQKHCLTRKVWVRRRESRRRSSRKNFWKMNPTENALSVSLSFCFHSCFSAIYPKNIVSIVKYSLAIFEFPHFF